MASSGPLLLLQALLPPLSLETPCLAAPDLEHQMVVPRGFYCCLLLERIDGPGAGPNAPQAELGPLPPPAEKALPLPCSWRACADAGSGPWGALTVDWGSPPAPHSKGCLLQSQPSETPRFPAVCAVWPCLSQGPSRLGSFPLLAEWILAMGGGWRDRLRGGGCAAVCSILQCEWPPPHTGVSPLSTQTFFPCAFDLADELTACLSQGWLWR